LRTFVGITSWAGCSLIGDAQSLAGKRGVMGQSQRQFVPERLESRFW